MQVKGSAIRAMTKLNEIIGGAHTPCNPAFYVPLNCRNTEWCTNKTYVVMSETNAGIGQLY